MNSVNRELYAFWCSRPKSKKTHLVIARYRTSTVVREIYINIMPGTRDEQLFVILGLINCIITIPDDHF